MNAPVTFNTLAFVRRLGAAGMDARQAEALAEALGEVGFETTATKGDIRELERRFAAKFRDLDIRARDLVSRLKARIGVMLAGSTTLTVAILGALISLN